MSTSLASSKISALKDRAEMFGRVRAFFAERSVLEVDCPALGKASPIDLHIDVMSVFSRKELLGYLHTSPEYGMKRLLSAGMGDIYQMSHVFRDGEIGPLHNPEFTMVEWYRLNFTFERMIAETLDLIQLFLGPLTITKISYRDALLKFAGIDYLKADPRALLEWAHQKGITLPQEAANWDKETLLQLLMSALVEPRLGVDELCVLCDYPATQAALAKTRLKGEEAVADRFEIYFRGIELCNGYHELTDSQEQRRRLIAENNARAEREKEILKVDEHFLEALEAGMPDCCGVAVGFDRLLLLRLKKDSLSEILPLPWSEA